MHKIQEYVKNENYKKGVKKLRFLTVSQPVHEMPKHSSNGTQASSLDDYVATQESVFVSSVPADSIFTDDLQLAWSSLTPKQTKKIKRCISG